MKKTLTFDSISTNRLNILKTLLKSFYMGEYMPPIEVVQDYYDFKLDPNKSPYPPGKFVYCTVKEHISRLQKIHELEVHFKCADSEVCFIEYWRLDDVNKWIDAE